MNQNKFLAKNTLIIGIGKFSTQIITLLLLPIYTIFLDPSEYGLIDLIITYIALLVPVLTVQLEMATFRYLVDTRHDENSKKHIISNVLQMVAIILGVLLFTSVVIAQILDIKYLALIVLNICIAIFSNLFLQIARGLGDNNRFAKASVFSGFTTLIGVTLFVVLVQGGAAGVLWAMALANASCVLYLYYSLKLNKYLSLKQGSIHTKKKLLRYSLPLVPNGLSWWVISVSDRTIITIFLGLAANGIYAVSSKYAMIFASIFAVYSMALTESASLNIDTKASDKYLSDTNNASIKLFGSLGLVLIVLCPFVFNWLIGDEFQQASNYVPILIVAAFLNSIVGVYSAIYIAKKMTKQVATTSIIAAVINVILTAVFISVYGIYAAAVATAVAFLVMAIYRHYDLKKIISIKYQKWLLTKMAVAYTLVITLFYINNIYVNILNLILVAVIAYVFNSYLLNHARKVITKISSKQKVTQL